MIVLGPQRSGKSNLLAFFLDEVDSNVVFDSSHHPDEWSKWGPPRGYVVSSDPADIRRHPKVVYQVPMEALMDVHGWDKPGTRGWEWTQALDNVIWRGNTHVVFDEIVHQLPAGRRHPKAMIIYTQGAKYGITPNAGSQFANLVETTTIRAATHCCCFGMNPYDLDIVGKRRGCDTAALAKLGKYAFGYHLTNTASWRICSPVERVM